MLRDAIARLLQHRVELNICDGRILCHPAIDRRHHIPLSLVAILNNESLQSAARTSRPILSPEVHHPLIAHGQPHLHPSSLAFKWEVHLGANVLRLRTSLAGRMNTTISICLRVQDGLQAREQKELRGLDITGVLQAHVFQARIRTKERRAETMGYAILHPLRKYFIRI